MSNLISVTVSDGKYTIQEREPHKWECLRYGETWPAYALSGPSNLEIALAYEVDTLRKQTIPDELFHHEGSDMSEADSYLIESALQAGAVHLNDDATAYGFTQENLVRLIRCALNKDFLPLWDNKNEG